ncbi:MAG: hypothetical protein RL641_327 [Candidatus Parcubacteria bacterium]|jgi:radical SAM superfamily enzyme YgiQ (UPF0313 family)
MKKILAILLVLGCTLPGFSYSYYWVPECGGSTEYLTFHPDGKYFTYEKLMPTDNIGRIPVPAKKRVEIKFHWLKPGKISQCILLPLLPSTLRRQRFVLINVEETILDKTKESDRQYRAWPHLGILFVGTVAHEEGWDVVLYDELVQGQIDLEKLIQPGDIVGLSLVVTGIERGTGLAKKAKELGARYVIAGNDSSIFRVNQLLALEGKPIDAVFTTNSLDAVRSFFQQINTVPIELLAIPGVETRTGLQQRSNEHDWLVKEMAERNELRKQGRFNPYDVFIVPKLDLYPQSYWEEVWGNYRSQFGHKHSNPETVKNALALFAQGCTRTQGVDACTYCTIHGVGDVRLPSRDYVVKTAQTYQEAGIDMVFNVTDSSFEMTKVVQTLIEERINFGSMVIYGRAQGIAKMPGQIDKWLSVVKDRLLINVGMDSGDDKSLKKGIIKSSVSQGSRVNENHVAIENIKKSGAHLHYSLIFGSPGETKESCDKSVEFLEWSIQTLGPQMDLCETDIYWLNFGSPAGKVFHDYPYAMYLASLAGKTITLEQWQKHFASFANRLFVPLEVEEAWYHFFTNIDLDTAQAYNIKCAQIMEKHSGSIRGRAFKPTLNT